MNLTSHPSHSHNVCVIIPREQHDNSPRCTTGQTAEKSTRERKGQQDPRRPHNLPGIWSLEPKLRLIFHNSMKKMRVVPRRASGHWNPRASPSLQSMNLTSHPTHSHNVSVIMPRAHHYNSPRCTTGQSSNMAAKPAGSGPPTTPGSLQTVAGDMLASGSSFSRRPHPRYDGVGRRG